jgi:hypothetical protein|tara:strand:- start:4981 stop:5238 length:258 start_codon:yes stop_codon:yes gene_type:complete
MNTLSTSIKREITAMTITELTQLESFVKEFKKFTAQSALVVGAKILVVQRTKQTPGIIKKINKSRALVDMRGKTYSVPFDMILPI